MRRVRLCTVTGPPIVVALLTIRAVQDTLRIAPTLETAIQVTLVVLTGAAGVASTWLATYGRTMPAVVTAAWLVVAIAAVYLSCHRAEPEARGPSLSVGTLTVTGGVVLALSAAFRPAWSLVFSAAAALAVWLPPGPGPSPWALAGLVAGAHLAGATSAWLYCAIQEIDNSRHELAALRVAEERHRFSHDVHDVVGRALSTIGVKAQLAAALYSRDDPRAEREMLSIAGVADEAAKETRLLALGYRDVDLGQELAGAQSLLEHAGIPVSVSGSSEDVPAPLREPMAWVVREGVTNILKHSNASRVGILIDCSRIAVRNDGARRIDARPACGTGLGSLASRLARLGGSLATACGDGQFVVEARFKRGTR
jgi:two-component system sensor histidine kinase DesK